MFDGLTLAELITFFVSVPALFLPPVIALRGSRIPLVGKAMFILLTVLGAYMLMGAVALTKTVELALKLYLIAAAFTILVR